MYKLEPI